MTDERPPRRGPFAAVFRVVKEALRYEGLTGEGRLNIAVLALIAIASIAVPLLSGTSIKWGPDGFEFSIGDASGAVVALVVVGIVCLVFVGGTNYLRARGKM